MNKFDINFFSKYIPEWQELVTVIHTHPVTILKWLFVKLSLFAVIPAVFYYYSITIQELIPFYFLEILLVIVYIKTMYEIFNWYNDVWIVTNEWVIWLERSFLKTNTNSINFDNIEWIWVEQEWIFDKIFMKWDLVIHKIWDDSFVLKDAINPLKAVNILENTSEEAEIVEEEKDTRFDMIMDALWWVVWSYLENNIKNNSEEDTKKEDKKQKIEKYKNAKNTIDLR